MDKNKKLFPQRLWELIHDEKYNFCLRWSPDGQRVYLNRNDFEAHYLKTPNNQFHTQKAISFVRQMNMYGFKKVDDCYYENDNFKRNCHHLLKNMVRRNSNKGSNLMNDVSAGDHMTMNTQLDSDDMMDQSCDIQAPTRHQHPLLIDSVSSNGADQAALLQYNRLQHQQQQEQQKAHMTIAAAAAAAVATSNQQHQHHHLQQQQQQQQQQHQQQRFNNHHRHSVDLYQVARQPQVSLQSSSTSSPANNQHDGVPSGEPNVALLEAVGAVMAAIGGNNGAGMNAAQMPLASSLYQRLAELNFSQANGPDLGSRHLNNQQHQSQVNMSEAIHMTSQQLEHNNCLLSAASRAIPNTNYNVTDIPMMRQNSAQQTLQQTLINSLLQMRQNQLAINMDQNFLANVQQQATPNAPISLLQPRQQTSPINHGNSPLQTSNDTTPLEVVMQQLASNNSSSLLSDDPHQQLQQHFFNIVEACNFPTGVPKAANSPFTITRMSSGSSSESSRANISGLTETYSTEQDEEFDDEDDENEEQNGRGLVYEGRLFKRPSGSLMGNSSSSSSNYAQDIDDANDTVLDLAKPSKSEQNGQHQMS